MENNSNKRITVKEMILSFSLLGVLSLVCIAIWKRTKTLVFLPL